MQCLSCNFAQASPVHHSAPEVGEMTEGMSREACFTSCMTLSKLLHLSEVCFSHLLSGKIEGRKKENKWKHSTDLGTY